MASSRWDPIVTQELNNTHYFYPASWLKLDYRVWWAAYRPRLMAAYPWCVTWREYVDRYRFFQSLDEALRR